MLTFFVIARNMKGTEMRQVRGMATGRPDCPTGTRMRGAMNTVNDMARSESVT